MISIVIPAYNREKYLGEAVASVMAQSYTSWELIIIDDGSSDRTGEMCDAFSRSDSRIHSVHTPNGGPSIARNRGVALCKGDWVTFLDADDVLHPRFLEIMVAAVGSTDADIINCDYFKFTGETCRFDKLGEMPPVETYSPKKALERALYQRGGAGASSCCKLYARGLWDNLSFSPGILYEDLEVAYRLWLIAGKLAHIPLRLYAYRQHPDSIIHTFTPQRADVLKVTEQIENDTMANHPELLAAAQDRRMSANFNIFLESEKAVRQHGYPREDARRLQHQCWQEIRRLRKQSLFNSNVRMRNRIGALISYLGPGILRKLYMFV